jgi:hypothetical protein
MAYRCVATSVAGFVQQLAVAYVTHGYWFYVTGHIPEHKNPVLTDRKLIKRYGIDVSKWTRARRKCAGEANVQYLRYGRFFLLLATHGKHRFFAAERKQLRDIRRTPLNFMGYSIACRRGRTGGKHHASVRIHRERFGELKAQFERIAVQHSVEEICGELRAIPYEPYAPVCDQLRILLRAVNRRRKVASLELVPWTALRLRRVPLKPFAPG